MSRLVISTFGQLSNISVVGLVPSTHGRSRPAVGDPWELGAPVWLWHVLSADGRPVCFPARGVRRGVSTLVARWRAPGSLGTRASDRARGRLALEAPV